MKRPLYLDYLASTPVDPQVAEAMMRCLTLDGNFGNPASRSHLYGWEAEEAVERARLDLADTLGVQARDIVWTSGATESDNLAIKGVAHAMRSRGRHIITSAIEHKAVLDSCRQLEAEGFEVTYLRPDAGGRIDPAQLAQAIRDDTTLVSLMHVNNELGTINDIEAIGRVCQQHNTCFHVDGAQAVGKVRLDLSSINVDLYAVSAHKFYGPKGIGALYVRRRAGLHLEAQMHGGGHERGMRSGTLATHQIVGLGTAARLANERLAEEAPRIAALRDQLWAGIADLPDVFVNGAISERIPGALNVAFAGLEGETLLMALKDLAVSSGSACTSASLEPSYVLRQIGLSDADAHASIRFSVGRFTGVDDINFAIGQIRDAVTRLHAING